MKRIGVLLLIAAMATPIFAAPRQLSVSELKDLLTSLAHAGKSDQEVANELKEVTLTEELSPVTMQSLGSLIPGPLSSAQLYAVEGVSATLPPPADAIPQTPPLDAAASQALLAKAQTYLSTVFLREPAVTATRLTARFQDGVENPPANVGVQSQITNESDPLFEQYRHYIRLMGVTSATVRFNDGVEQAPADPTKWGPNNLIASIGPPLTLARVLHDIAASGQTTFARWQTIDGQAIAVLNFTLDRKKTHYSVEYCCFPVTDTAGFLSHSQVSGGMSANTVMNESNMQSYSDWVHFKATPGYHGQLFVDPRSGMVVRTITDAEMKKTDFVHSEAIRTDYVAVALNGKPVVEPVRRFSLTEVVPYGDSFANRFTIRHSIVTEDYKDFQAAK